MDLQADGGHRSTRLRRRLTAMHRHARQLLVEQHMQSHQGPLGSSKRHRVKEGTEGPFSAARQVGVQRASPTRQQETILMMS